VLAWAEFPNGWHRLSHPCRVPSAWAGPCPLVDLLDMVAEMAVVGSAQNDHVLRGWGPGKELMHPGQRCQRVALGDEKERGDIPPLRKGEGGGNDPRSRLGTAPWASANTARIRPSTAGMASAAQPPKLYPVIPIQWGSMHATTISPAAPLRR
jgi:hypothetical protein